MRHLPAYEAGAAIARIGSRRWRTCTPWANGAPKLSRSKSRAGTRKLTPVTLANTVRSVKLVDKQAPSPNTHGVGEKQAENHRNWIAALEPLLPRHLRSNPNGFSIHFPDSVIRKRRILETIFTARKQHGIDVLYELGLKQGRWQAMTFVAQTIVDFNAPSSMTQLEAVSETVMKSPYLGTLDDLTQNPFLAVEAPFLSRGSWIPFEKATQKGSLSTDTQKRSMEGLGQLWISLGEVFLAAADKEDGESDFIVEQVLTIVATLHSRGLIPQNVYHQQSNDDPSALQQPVLLNFMSSHMIHSLSDTMVESHITDAHTRNSEGSGYTRSLMAPEWRYKRSNVHLGPELWLEFVLWCCVHGGWFSEGATILQAMKARSGPSKWSLVLWHDMSQYPNLNWRSFHKLRQEGLLRKSTFQDQSNSKDLLSESAKRTISAEVVVAIIGGLMSKIDGLDSQNSGYNVRKVLELVADLKIILSRDGMNLGTSSWDAIIARFFETPEVQAGSDVRLIADILGLSDTSGLKPFALNTPPALATSSPSADYILEGSTALLGMYHHAISAAIEARDLQIAVELLARLQSLTGGNKPNSLARPLEPAESRNRPLGFYKGLTDVESREKSSNVEHPGNQLNFPPRVLASLLDLMVDSKEFELAKWMIYSTNVGGPLIHEELYGNQTLAPALIRYAACTNDENLMRAVTNTETDALAGRTLVALCDSRIRQADWRGAHHVLDLTNNFNLYTWTAVDICQLLRSLMLHVSTSRSPRKRNSNADQAERLLQRVLACDMGSLSDQSFPQMNSIIGFVADIHPALATSCESFLRTGHTYPLNMSVECFDILVDGAMDAYGAETGRRLWERWCRGSTLQRVLHLPRPSHDEAHGIEDSTTIFSGHVPSKLSSLRVLVAHALNEQPVEPTEEFVTGSVDQEENDLSLIEWICQEMTLAFELSPTEIVDEFQGFLSADVEMSQRRQDYSENTLRIWTNFTGSRKNWAQALEDRLRAFMLQPAETEYVCEAPSTLEKMFLHSLAKDYGLHSENRGARPAQTTHIFKTRKEPWIPTITVSEVAQRRKQAGKLS